MDKSPLRKRATVPFGKGPRWDHSRSARGPEENISGTARNWKSTAPETQPLYSESCHRNEARDEIGKRIHWDVFSLLLGPDCVISSSKTEYQGKGSQNDISLLSVLTQNTVSYLSEEHILQVFEYTLSENMSGPEADEILLMSVSRSGDCGELACGVVQYGIHVWVSNGVHSASWVQLRRYLEEKVAAPV
jgi:hypothetical protein